MKQTDQETGDSSPARTCGTCGRTLVINWIPEMVACLVNLEIMHADHPGRCEHYVDRDITQNNGSIG